MFLKDCYLYVNTANIVVLSGSFKIRHEVFIEQTGVALNTHEIPIKKSDCVR